MLTALVEWKLITTSYQGAFDWIGGEHCMAWQPVIARCGRSQRQFFAPRLRETQSSYLPTFFPPLLSSHQHAPCVFQHHSHATLVSGEDIDQDRRIDSRKTVVLPEFPGQIPAFTLALKATKPPCAATSQSLSCITELGTKSSGRQALHGPPKTSLAGTKPYEVLIAVAQMPKSEFKVLRNHHQNVQDTVVLPV